MFDLIGRELGQFAGHLPVAKCTEATLVSWRDQIERNPKLTSKGINRKIQAALHVLKCGRARGLVPKSVSADISCIEPLKHGEVGDRPEHGRPRPAVTFEEAEKVAKQCCRQVAAMLRLQALCGMRPGEVIAMRWADIDNTPTDGDTTGAWLYVVPAGGKTGHHSHVTRNLLTKTAQQVLQHFPALPLANIFTAAG